MGEHKRGFLSALSSFPWQVRLARFFFGSGLNAPHISPPSAGHPVFPPPRHALDISRQHAQSFGVITRRPPFRSLAGGVLSDRIEMGPLRGSSRPLPQRPRFSPSPPIALADGHLVSGTSSSHNPHHRHVSAMY